MSDETPLEAPAVDAAVDGQPADPPPPPPIAPTAEHPELPVAAAFVGGLVLARLLKRLAR